MTLTHPAMPATPTSARPRAGNHEDGAEPDPQWTAAPLRPPRARTALARLYELTSPGSMRSSPATPIPRQWPTTPWSRSHRRLATSGPPGRTRPAHPGLDDHHSPAKRHSELRPASNRQTPSRSCLTHGSTQGIKISTELSTGSSSGRAVLLFGKEARELRLPRVSAGSS